MHSQTQLALALRADRRMVEKFGVIALLLAPMAASSPSQIFAQNAESGSASAATADHEDASAAGDSHSSESTTQPEDETTNVGSAGGGLLGRLLGRMFGSGADEDLSPLLGEPAPGFELKSPTGDIVRLEDFRGKVVVLDFWATWCGPCVRGMPQLQALHEELAGQEVAVLGVNQQETADQVRAFLEEKKFDFLQVLDQDGAAGNAYLVSGIPQTVVIDPQGEVQLVHIGYAPGLGKDLAQAIKKIQNGEKLYDEAKVAAARAKRLEEFEQLNQKIGPLNADQWQIVGSLTSDLEVDIDWSFPDAWVILPDSGKRALARDAGNNQVMLLPAGSDAPEVVELQWDGEFRTWQVYPTLSRDELRWTAVGYRYDDDYDMELAVAQFDRSGALLWNKAMAISADSFSLAIGDLTGDSEAEVAMLASYSDVEFGPEARDVSRVLTVWDDGGTIVSRRWIRGSGGTGLYILPEASGNVVLLKADNRLVRMRLAPMAK